MTYPDNVEDLKVDVQGTDAMTAHAELHNDANKVVNSLQAFVGTKTDNATSGTIAGNINDLVVRVEEIETNGGGSGGGDSFPDTTDHDGHALMVRSDTVDWSQITPDDVRYPENVVFVLPDEELEIGGKTQGEINIALRDALRQLDGAVETNIENISINEESFTELLASLDLEISIENDGSINIYPNGGNPGETPPSLSELETKVDNKFDKGSVSVLTDAGIMETEIRNVGNRLTALENTSLTASWKINISDSATPADGEIVINAATWEAVTNLKVATKDADGTIHSFGNVAEGDTVQIGVGPEARAAGSSAAYIIDAINADGDYNVSHLSSSGTPSQDFIAIIAVYPAFDPSNYATKGELDSLSLVVDSKLDAGEGKSMISAVEEKADQALEEVEELKTKEYLTTDIKLANPSENIRTAGYQTQSDFNNAFAPFFTEGSLKWHHLSQGLNS